MQKYVRNRLLILFLLEILKRSSAWNAPSFTSPWVDIQAQDPADAVVNIAHTLGEVPAKVDVQVKVIKNDIDYIFTGAGSAQRDDDYSETYGGVIYVYNAGSVIIYLPYAQGGIAYTGSQTKYNGPTSSPVEGKHVEGYVRVRLWKHSDFPAPLFSHSVIVSNQESNCYKEINHGSGKYADLVTAQTELSDGYFSDGQGAVFHDQPSNAQDNSLAGLVYAYSDNYVRIWVPKQDGSNVCGNVFSKCDGWGDGSASGSDCYKASGTVTVRGYILTSDIVFEDSFHTQNAGLIKNSISFSPSTHSVDDALVSVQVQQTTGTGYIFNGAGSAQSASSKFGGVVYVYTNKSVLLWIPDPSYSNGYLIYVNERWGAGREVYGEKTGKITVKVFASVITNCSIPENVISATYEMDGTLVGSTVTYTCDNGFVAVSGDLIQTCEATGTWSGSLPVCIEIQCPEGTMSCQDPGTVANGNYSVPSLSIGGSVTYWCDPGFNLKYGDLVRECGVNCTWSGLPPVCIDIPVITCVDPGNVANASYVLQGTNIGSTVSYTCDSGYQYETGYLTRTCSANGTWDGLPPVCIEIPVISCVDPGNVANASYVLQGTNIGSTVSYTCDSGYQFETGYLTRTCTANGTWDGVPPVCTVQTIAMLTQCSDPDEITNATRVVNGFNVGSTVEYTCVSGYKYAAGFLIRKCQSDGKWDGVPPVCIEIPVITCVDPGNVANASYVLQGTHVGSTVSYTCDSGYQYETGHLTRTCIANGTWDGVPPVCIANPIVRCPDPENIPNATRLYSNTIPWSTVQYSCNLGYKFEAGCLTRTCQIDGTWDCTLPVCSSTCISHCSSQPVVHTTETLAESIKTLEKELTVEPKTTKLYQRTLVCAKDDRPSSTAIGWTGAILLCGLLSTLIIPDLFTMVRHIRNINIIYNKKRKSVL